MAGGDDRVDDGLDRRTVLRSLQGGSLAGPFALSGCQGFGSDGPVTDGTASPSTNVTSTDPTATGTDDVEQRKSSGICGTADP